jgi:hypothetical protein
MARLIAVSESTGVNSHAVRVMIFAEWELRGLNMRELIDQPMRKYKGWKCCIRGACSGGALGTVVAVEKLCTAYRAGQIRHVGSRSEAGEQFCVFGARITWGHAPIMLAAFGRKDVGCNTTKSKGSNVGRAEALATGERQ